MQCQKLKTYMETGRVIFLPIRAIRPNPAQPRKIFSEEELADFDGSWEDFARLWTVKESWCKRQDIPLYPPRKKGLPDCPCKGYGGEDWRAAVCCSDEPPEAIVWLEKV